MELLFYHLEQSSIERVLPELVTKSIEKGWRVIIETAPAERVETIDGMLWTFTEDSFLPHGTVSEDTAADQTVLITDQIENTNSADIRFFVDAGDVTAHQGYERLVYIFNGNNETLLNEARAQWKAARVAELSSTYWQQNRAGRWEKKA